MEEVECLRGRGAGRGAAVGSSDDLTAGDEGVDALTLVEKARRK